MRTVVDEYKGTWTSNPLIRGIMLKSVQEPLSLEDFHALAEYLEETDTKLDVAKTS